ncbi:uncharacterized protein LOC141906143 [Tubulanus polymorphus]|uniref:uncharacterized protein LOC141906143 n=1 Tax=Tubulanus polymorphus TaxID=672921 RepID=UPI003DA6611E
MTAQSRIVETQLLPSNEIEITPKNLTGAYLGQAFVPLHVRRNNAKNHKLTRIQDGQIHQVNLPLRLRREKTSSHISRTGQRSDNDLLRCRENVPKELHARRGFSGNPVKRRANSTNVPPTRIRSSNNSAAYSQIDRVTSVDALIKKNPRSFTASNNSGVKYYEYLHYDGEEQASNCRSTSPDTEVHTRLQSALDMAKASVNQDFATLEECYKNLLKIEKDDSQKKSKCVQAKQDTSSAMEYRNPNTAMIIATFPSDYHQHTGAMPRPHTGNPFFNRTFEIRTPSAKSDRDARVQDRSSRVPSLGGSVFSRSIAHIRSRFEHKGSPSPPDSPKQTPSTSTSKISRPTTRTTIGSRLNVLTSVPILEKDENLEGPVLEQKEFECNATKQTSDMGEKLDDKLGGIPVCIDLKNEDGETESVEIDEVDELLDEKEKTPNKSALPDIPMPYGRCRRQSITDRLQKRRSSEIATEIIRLSAQARRREFEDLLDEHAHLVDVVNHYQTEINLAKKMQQELEMAEMEKERRRRRSLADKENSTMYNPYKPPPQL